MKSTKWILVVLIVASNILVQMPINDWLTWGALTYPMTFLVTDLINRGDGPRAARRRVEAQRRKGAHDEDFFGHTCSLPIAI